MTGKVSRRLSEGLPLPEFSLLTGRLRDQFLDHPELSAANPVHVWNSMSTDGHNPLGRSSLFSLRLYGGQTRKSLESLGRVGRAIKPQLSDPSILSLKLLYFGQEKCLFALSASRLRNEIGVQNDVASAEFYGMVVNEQIVVFFH